MEPYVATMFIRVRNCVANDPVFAFQEKNAAFKKTVVFAGDQVKPFLADPLAKTARELCFPRERAARKRRRLTVERHRVVRGGAAKPVSEFFGTGVSVSAGIYEHGAAVSGDVDRECVRVRMTATERAVCSTIEEQVV